MDGIVFSYLKQKYCCMRNFDLVSTKGGKNQLCAYVCRGHFLSCQTKILYGAVHDVFIRKYACKIEERNHESGRRSNRPSSGFFHENKSGRARKWINRTKSAVQEKSSAWHCKIHFIVILSRINNIPFLFIVSGTEWDCNVYTW